MSKNAHNDQDEVDDLPMLAPKTRELASTEGPGKYNSWVNQNMIKS
jgi:hypothetical protein